MKCSMQFIKSVLEYLSIYEAELVFPEILGIYAPQKKAKSHKIWLMVEYPAKYKVDAWQNFPTTKPGKIFQS